MESVNYFDAKLFKSSHLGDLEGVVDALAQGGRVTMRDHQGHTPLLEAAHKGHTDICALLLAHGSDVNETEPETKMTALHCAALRGHEAVVEALLSWGALVDPRALGGVTPLCIVCQGGHLACLLALLKAGANVSLPNNLGILPIHVAAGQNRVEIVRTLLDYDCSPDMLNCKTGKTPLMHAAFGGADETVAFLLSKGADPDLMCNNGDTALVAAIQSQRLSTIDLLAPVTQKGLGRALQWLFTSQTERTPAVEGLLERARSDDDALRALVDPAAWPPGLEGALKNLVTRKTESTPAAKELLERASSDKEKRKRKRTCFCFCF